MNSIPVVIFLGAPGAGKGTQAAYLSHHKGIPKISTGDMLRAAVQDDSALGRKVKEIMRDGGLVDDETMLNLIKDRISKPDSEKGFILDGFPRTCPQAEGLEKILPANSQMVAINIRAAEEAVVKRIAGRRSCPKCGTVYNVYFHPPKVDDQCDLDGTLLFRRNDDSEDVVRKRLKTYKRETLPLIGYYKKKGVLKAINGVLPEKEVMDLVLKAVPCASAV